MFVEFKNPLARAPGSNWLGQAYLHQADELLLSFGPAYPNERAGTVHQRVLPATKVRVQEADANA